MNTNIIGAVAAFIVGVLIATAGYLILRLVLKKHPEKYVAAQILKQTLQIGFIFLLFVFADKTPCDSVWLLVGGCLGVTLPMLLYTPALIKLNNSSAKKEKSDNG